MSEPRSSSGSETPALPPNILKINEDIVKHLEKAPVQLRAAYQRDGYGGANEWCRGWRELVDTVVRVYQFGLLTEASRTKALRACDACLALRIAVDDIYAQSSRLRHVLDPSAVHDD